MVEIITAQPVEIVAMAYLRKHLPTGTLISTRVPAKRPASFITVTASGGTQDRNIVLTARMVTIRCWDTDEAAAARTAEQCFGILQAAPRDATQDDIRRCVTVGAPQSLWDQEPVHPRYQLTVALTLRAR